MRRARLLVALTLASCGAPVEPRPPPVALVAPTAAAQPAPPPRRAPNAGPHGEIAELAGARVSISVPSHGAVHVGAALLHPPPGERALLGISPTALLFLDDGTLLVGSADGTLAAIDGMPPADPRRRCSLGFRGAIRGLAPAGEGLAAVTTELGVMALVTSECRLRWERQVTGEPLGPPAVAADGKVLASSHRAVFALSSGGQLAFSHASPLLQREKEAIATRVEGDDVVAGKGLRFRLDGPHPAAPGLEPTFPLTFRKVLDGGVTSLLAIGPDVWALVQHQVRGDTELPALNYDYEVVRVQAGGLTRFPLPAKASKSEVFLAKTRAAQAPLLIDALAAGPDGVPWILGRRVNFDKTWCESGSCGTPGGAGQILEIRGGKVQEIRDLFGEFFDHLTYARIAAAPDAPASLLCFGEAAPACAARSASGFDLLAPPGQITSVGRIGGGEWLVNAKGALFRRAGKGFEPIETPRGAVLKAVAGTSEQDVWADGGDPYSLLHFDGQRWTDVPVPLSAEGLSPRAAGDAWRGRLRWDGARWSPVFGVPRTREVLARGPDDVWTAGDGLFHGTAPGPVPVRLPAPAQPDEDAIPAPPALELAAPEARFAVERVTFPIATSPSPPAARPSREARPPRGRPKRPVQEPPLTSARTIAAAPDGVLWVEARYRLFEVDGDRATALRRNIEERESASRGAHPQARGRGIFLSRDESLGIEQRDEIQRIDGSSTVREDVQLDQHDAVAVDGVAGGSTWVVGASPSFTPSSRYWDSGAELARRGELWPHALVRSDDGPFRPVLGLPSASWCDVAAAPDGGAWFAGALNAGPAGEGILFHARGRWGSEATSRFRAPASLLAVTAVGADEAWAVGAAGTVIHVHGSEVARYALASGEWLRAAASTGPDDVWIAGDGGTLLHYDGRAFHPVDHPLGAHAAFTGLASARGALWAVGPAGILRIVRRAP